MLGAGAVGMSAVMAAFSLECTGKPEVLRQAVDMLGSDAIKPVVLFD